MEKKFQLKNTTIDMIHGPIFKSIVLFAIPILISSVFQQLYNTMDTFIVGRFLGDTALAAIGSVNSVFDLINGFALGIGNGLAIVTARAFGSGDQEELKKSVAGSLVIGLASSVLITILAFIGIKPLMHAINVPNHVFNQAYSYIIWIILFLTIMFAYNLAAGLLRAIGNSVMPLLFLIFSSLLNVGLDILFITQFHLGVADLDISYDITDPSSFGLLLHLGQFLGHFIRSFLVDVTINESIANRARVWIAFTVDDAQQMQLGVIALSNVDSFLNRHLGLFGAINTN